MRDRHGQFSYLLIPELHKSGAVHFHGLLGNVPADFVEVKCYTKVVTGVANEI